MALVLSLAVLSVVGCSLAAGVITPPPGTTPTHVIEPITTVLDTCIRASKLRFTDKVSVMCAKVPEVDECFRREEGKWNQTHDQSLNKVFAMYRQFGEDRLKKLCDKDGEKLSNILEGFNSFRNSTFNGVNGTDRVMQECLFFIPMTFKIADKSRADLASKVWFLYHMISNVRACFDKYMYLDVLFIKAFKEFAEDTMEILRCLRVPDEAVVPCEEVDPSSIDRTHMCPVRLNPLPEYGSFLEQSLVNCTMETSSDWNLTKAQSLRDFQVYFEDFCRKKQQRFTHCRFDTSLAADLCLSGSDFNKFELVISYLGLVREASCAGEGRGLATLFFGFHLVNNGTGEDSSPVTDCLQGTLLSDGGNLDVRGYYDELPTIRECLLGKLPEDSAFVNVLDDMFDEIRDRMKCQDPVNGNVVLCKDIF